MNTSIDEMLKKYNAITIEDKKNAMKEIMQEIVLCGLSRAGFFKKAAFYGGTALRIFYGLDRFSEDLDFSLVTADLDFDMQSYFPVLEKEAEAYGLKVQISEKVKSRESAVKSAFLKGNTKEYILLFYSDPKLAGSVQATENIKIKFEVDTNPPSGAGYDNRYRLLPSPYEIRLYDLPSLFAGKIHAVICRAWKNMVKGRDLYDYIFYLQKNSPVNMEHLRQRLIDSGVLTENDDFNDAVMKEMLYRRFDLIDFESAKEDVRPFIKDKGSLELWSAGFFKQITDTIRTE